MGGEKPSFGQLYCLLVGSPPRGRGKVQLDDPEEGDLGITPAWAGKSSALCLGRFGGWDHPRVGGEKIVGICVVLPHLGSPPRGRGKAACGALAGGVQRITPAWAGKRFCKEIAPPSVEDHPRVGGEKHKVTTAGRCPAGSPPRGRGKVENALLLNLLDRITPAWAGKRHHRAPKSVKRKDHPRVGGEKAFIRMGAGGPLGSPPRGRGKDRCSMALADDNRITPAWAGKRKKINPGQTGN